jgi:hypothetical protein
MIVNPPRKCPKSSKFEVVSHRIQSPFTSSIISGTVTFAERLENVIGFRLAYVNVTRMNTITDLQGNSIMFRSNKLGSMLATNPYRITRWDEGTPNTAMILSNVIGIYPTEFNFQQHIFHEFMMPEHYFTQAMPIDRFDWQVEATTGSFNITTVCALEFAIEFFVVCNCK